MTVTPLLVMSGGSGPSRVIDLTTTCPSVDVTPPGGGPPPTGAGAGGLIILLGVGLLAITMTSKKEKK